MKIVLVYNDSINEIDVDPGFTAADIIPVAAALANVPREYIMLVARGQHVPEAATISSVADGGDCLMVIDTRQVSERIVPDESNPTAQTTPASPQSTFQALRSQAVRLATDLQASDPVKAKRIAELSVLFKDIKVPGKNKTVTAPQPVVNNMERVRAKFAEMEAEILNDPENKAGDIADRMMGSLDPSTKLYIQENPKIGRAVEDKDRDLCIKLIKGKWLADLQKNKEEMEKYDRAMQNPDTEESQRYLYELARKDNASSLWAKAANQVPEFRKFTNMLFLPCEINGHKTQMMVDTGAQSTIMSYKTAEKLGITHLIDESHVLVMQGIGATRSRGTIPILEITIGEQVIKAHVGVLENISAEMLLGLDAMRNNGVTIDVVTRKMTFNGHVVECLSDEAIRELGITSDEQIAAHEQMYNTKKMSQPNSEMTEEQRLHIEMNEKISLVADSANVDTETARKTIMECDGDTALAIAILKSMQK